ncbi:F-box/WD repeat-containing protein 1A [Xylariales sp. AK1849]|nr:F-box/WD repeat-containing protein 1A [Xylariales sp. AK1849]
MEPFPPAQEPDEGYSEHPLYPSSADSDIIALAGNSRDPADFLAWLSPRLSTLTTPQKTDLAMSILNELPTSVIAEIVIKHLNPRLYIDFVDYLPTEICLKIFGYLDPASLINVARSCRGWYDLALDRKIWESVFYLEGWKAIPEEILAAEKRMNAGSSTLEVMQPQRLRSSEYGHTHKKRAISDPTPQETEDDHMDVDQDDKVHHRDTEMSGTSLFGGVQAGGSGSSSKSTGSVIQHLGHLMMSSPSPMPEETRTDVKGKGRATANFFVTDSRIPSMALPGLPKSALWTYDAKDGRYKINWQYLYTTRRRLEYNWEAGNYTNFQLPHPNYPQEGHKECVYSLQYNSEYLVSGSRDQTIRIWNMHTRRLARKPLRGHTGSVLCLQFDSDPEEDLIVSGSSDSDVVIWKFSTGERLQCLKKAHTESVLNVKFDKRILVTCSKDRSIKIFNRRPLRAGEPGYGDVNLVSPVPTNLRNYDYNDSPWNQLPIKPPYTQIGCLEGHGAAVNAVQIHGDEIVSASGDRHIKVWDWPHQICRRTFLGHHKGIACVQYDGRRIISGSSDNEVKVFDRETGLEVATLRGHGNLVRTVQAGFGDLPYSVEEDHIAAKAIDNEYFAAVKAGSLGNSYHARGKPPNAGGRRPEDITAYGARLPPGGGGGPYGRIVSGSYDQTIMIWRRNKDGKWRKLHILRFEEAAAAATTRQTSTPNTTTTAIRVPSPVPSPTLTGGSNTLPALHHNARPIVRLPPPPPSASAPPTMQGSINLTHVEHPIHATVTPQSTMSYTRMIENYVPQGPATLQSVLASFPTMLAYQSEIQRAIDQEPNAMIRSQTRQVVAAAVQRAQLAQTRIKDSVEQAMTASTSSAVLSTSQSISSTAPAPASQPSVPNQPSTREMFLNRHAAAAITTRRTVSQATPRAAPQSTAQGSSTQAAAHSARVTDNETESTAGTTPIMAAATSSVSAGPPLVVNGTSQRAQFYQQAQQQQNQPQPLPQTPAQMTPTAAPPAAPANIPAHHVPIHHPHIAQADPQQPRVFKLQFDAHKIICCSQQSTIVGWDFCNGDPELEEAARFFAPIE